MPSFKQRLVSSLLMSFLLSLALSCWVSFINLGPGPGFVESWFKAFAMAWPVSAGMAFLCTPFVSRITSRLLS
ncbi:DUF2798 domain-containing protein [Kiloniella sp. b19]|uniref:DUF2798 domain-containing protein n=1 Tax=Kiloniella sp. GXU_MW_B19 TaxID=3141326 RepID=UPI0031CEC029